MPKSKKRKTKRTGAFGIGGRARDALRAKQRAESMAKAIAALKEQEALEKKKAALEKRKATIAAKKAEASDGVHSV